MLHPASQVGSPCCQHLSTCLPFWGSGLVMFRTKFSLGTSVNVVFPSRVLVFQLSVTPGEWPEADACVGTGVAPAALEPQGPWSSRGSSSPPALRALRSAAAVVAWLAPPLIWTLRTGPPAFPARRAILRLASTAFKERRLESAAPPATPQPCPLGLAVGPCPHPVLSPEHLAPFSSLL